MCRNIKTLFNFGPPVTDEEVRAASLQFVRKISGFTKPSKANEAAFLSAVEEVAGVSARLLRALETTAPPRTAKKKLPRRRHARRSVSATKRPHSTAGARANVLANGASRPLPTS
jgi:hypothetical protein